MRPDRSGERLIVFDIGGTWFRWGVYDSLDGLTHCWRSPAINYLSHPDMEASELQDALVEFIAQRVRDIRAASDSAPTTVSLSMGAPVNAHDMRVLGSGPLWGPAAQPFDLKARLERALPEMRCNIINDVTALLARYMSPAERFRKTMLITISSGIGSRIYDHRTERIPYDSRHGVQGEIGHLPINFELDRRLIRRQCECGGWNHMNAFASGRGIAQTLLHLPDLSSRYSNIIPEDADTWRNATHEYRLSSFLAQLSSDNGAAVALLDAMVAPLTRILAAALALDPELDRIVITGGVAHGLGTHYKQALERTFAHDGLYQISDRDPSYLTRRLIWDEADDFAGLLGAALYDVRASDTTLLTGLSEITSSEVRGGATTTVSRN